MIVLTGALVLAPLDLSAQSSYYNLDGSRPLRIEDAAPTERYALDVQLLPLRIDRYARGRVRARVEPKVSYGILPLTELEVRFPVVAAVPVRATAPWRVGGAGIGVGILHAFGVETGALPAVAVGGEVLLRAGALAGSRTSYSTKAIITRTTRFARLHLNGAYGTFALREDAVRSGACNPGSPGCAGPGPGVPPDPPIDFPCAPPAVARAARCAPGEAAAASALSTGIARAYGTHWLAGAGIDHAFGLHSFLIGADLVAERFVGLYAPTDWTAEVGARRQLTQRLTIDGALGWHFAGAARSTSATLGLTWETALRPPAGLPQ